MLDKGLTWKKQLDKAITKAYKAFWTCRDTFGKTWGLKPKVVYWIYTAVVRLSSNSCNGSSPWTPPTTLAGGGGVQDRKL
jgi:hypothetical protein